MHAIVQALRRPAGHPSTTAAVVASSGLVVIALPALWQVLTAAGAA